MSKKATDFLLILFLFLFGCGSPPPPTPTPTLSPPATPSAMLTRVQGQVNVQQVITGQTMLASTGNLLWQGDVITTGEDAQVELLCIDGIHLEVDANQSVTITCGETPDPVYQQIILRIHREQIEALPSPRPAPSSSDPLPVVLSPRNTQLVEERPTIRWLPLEGAEKYEVVVYGPESELWRMTTQEVELPYPEEQPGLKAGVNYLIQVTANMGPTEQLRSSETVLVTMLSEAEMEQVHRFEAQIERLDLSAESTRFFLAVYYTDRELYDAAITQLVSLVEEAPSPAIHRLLGYLYLAIELNDEAARSYQEASRLAQTQHNQLVQAEAEVGLGHVAYVRKDFVEALSHYQAALRLYQALGLESDAEAVGKFVSDTESWLPTPTP